MRIKREKLLTEKLAARAAAKDYLGDLQQKGIWSMVSFLLYILSSYFSTLKLAVVERLQKTGVFQDPLQLEIQNQFLPWLTEQVLFLFSF